MQWVRLGLIGKTYRLDGSFFVSERDSVIPKSVKWVVLTRPGTPDLTDSDSETDSHVANARFAMARSRPQAKRVVAKLAEISHINAITPWQGSSIWTTRDQIPLDDDKEYLWAELESRSIIDKDGEAFGRIIAVQNYGAGDVIEVESPSGATLMLPFNDYYIDMSFGESGTIQLTVSGDVFAEVWQEGNGKAKPTKPSSPSSSSSTGDAAKGSKSNKSRKEP